eukprot:IDg8904t1
MEERFSPSAMLRNLARRLDVRNASRTSSRRLGNGISSKRSETSLAQKRTGEFDRLFQGTFSSKLPICPDASRNGKSANTSTGPGVKSAFLTVQRPFRTSTRNCSLSSPGRYSPIESSRIFCSSLMTSGLKGNRFQGLPRELALTKRNNAACALY